MSEYELITMPHVQKSMDRVLAWYNQEIIDRAPIRFSEHNSVHNMDISEILKGYNSIRDYWFDVDFHVSSFLASVKDRIVHAETFPVFFPNLGPSVYAAYYGATLEFAPVTSWANHTIGDIENFDMKTLKLDCENEYWKKIDELTDAALSVCKGNFFVGYTDLHPSMDCVADFMGPEYLCISMYDCPDKVRELAEIFYLGFPDVFEYYGKRLKDMPSVTWMGIPTARPMHIPSCDFSSMISTKLFEEFCLPFINREIALAPYNIFHLDGPGVAKHLDLLLEIPGIQAIQWVQGVGEDEPILQWVPLIRKIQDAGKSVVVGLKISELEAFMDAVSPKGIYLTLDAAYELQDSIVKRVEKWV